MLAVLARRMSVMLGEPEDPAAEINSDSAAAVTISTALIVNS